MMTTHGIVLAGLIAGINLLTFVLFAVDKHCARKGYWRVPERTLLHGALVGGWPAAKLAQWLLRHKTRKEPFRSRLNRVGWFQAGVIVLGLALIGQGGR
jgi:uncharacterized membrane protein YsdA (DUF1294 family)